MSSSAVTISKDRLGRSPEISGEHGNLYQEQGFLLVPNALTADEIQLLREETARLCNGDRGEIRGLNPKVDGETDDDAMARVLCIHFPHKVSEIMHDFLSQEVVVAALKQAIGPNIKCMQSMLFIKASGKPGQAWHQDEYSIPTRDRSLTGVSFAIDDATVENGCLWVIPGSHQHGILWPQRAHNDMRFDCSAESYKHPYSDDDAIPIEMKAGSILLFNGYLMHRSLPNGAAAGYRRSLTSHYMSAESLLPWNQPGLQQNPKEPQGHIGIGKLDCRDIVMVAGRDPYGYKGIADFKVAHIRPSGEGGCANEYHNIGRPPPLGRM